MALFIGTNAPTLAVGGAPVSRVYLGSDLLFDAAPASRPLIAPTESIGESAHSFLAEPTGSLSWSGPIILNYMGGSNVKDRWDANGLDRTGDYSGALIVATFGDFEVGTYPPDSAEGIDELQHLYWYALTAQAKGCRLLIVYPIWTPPGPPTSWDTDTMARTIAKVGWLNARPEITLRVVTAPTPILARQLEAYYAPTSIWRDGLHMVDPPVPGMRAIRGMGLMVHSMLTGARYAGAAIDAEDGVMADMAWAVVRDYACTGLGGATVIAPYPLATDPLPSPLPLDDPPTPAPPVRVSAPVISGSLVVGETLTIGTPAVYSGYPNPTITYSWQSRPNGGGTIVSHPTGPSFTLTEDLAGRQIRTRDMASNSQGSVGWSVGGWSAAVVAGAAPDPIPGTLTNPPFSINLRLVDDYAMSHSPFVNRLNTAAPFDPTERHTYALVNKPADSGDTGHYRLTWGQEATFTVLHADNDEQINPNEIQFDYVANGSRMVYIHIDSGSPTNIKLVRQSDWAADDAGEIFNPAWVDLIRNERVLRVKDWMKIDNYEGDGTWANRAHVGDSFNGPSGVPIEHILTLCNQVGADPWFCIPHNATDDYVTQMAQLVLANLRTEQRVYVEYTNKIWDFNLSQAGWNQSRANTLFGTADLEGAWQHYGGRSAEIAMLWRAVWTGANAARLRTVLQCWTDNHSAEGDMLAAPRWRALQGGRLAPSAYMTDYAVHALVDGGLGSDDPSSRAVVQGWRNTMTTAQLYDRMALACRDHANGPIGEGRSLARLIDDWAYHKGKADAAGLRMICYEGGTHMVTPPSHNGDPDWNADYNGFHYSPQFAALWSDVIDAFDAAGGVIMNKMFDVAYPNGNTNSGLYRFIGDENPQADVWVAQRAARQGPTGRGASDFIGTAEAQ